MTNVKFTSDLENINPSMFTKLCIFDELCKEHDLTYSYSDDHSAYTKGHEHHKKIMELSKEIPHNIAVQIWNKYVFEKLSEHYIEEYLWK